MVYELIRKRRKKKMEDIEYRDYVVVDTVDEGRVLCVAPFCSSLRAGDMVIIKRNPNSIVAPDTSISGIGKNIGVVVASASFSVGSEESKLLMTMAKTDSLYSIIGTVWVRMFEEEEKNAD
jgi:hypothetical protein